MKRSIARTALALLVSATTVVAGPTARGQGLDAASTASPRFSARIDNPWFPVTPGTIAVYTGVKDGKEARDVVTVTRETTTIARTPCRAVRDLLYLEGKLAERTTDWYTQDAAGNVWYFGERTAELDKRGRVTSTEGSWQAGVDGGKPGIFMPARPRVGDSFRQEFYKGHAEDHFRIIDLFESTVSTPTANALLTREWTPLEPDVIDHKLYVRGIGAVSERTVKGADEHLELVSLRRNRTP